MQRVKQRTKLEKISRIIVGICILLMLIFLTLVFYNENVDIYRSDSRAFDKNRLIENVILNKIEDINAPAQIIHEYSFILDTSIKHDTYLAFYTAHQYVDVYIDNQKVYHLRPDKDSALASSVGMDWTIIPLYREDVGKEVKIDITPAYKDFDDRYIDFYLGPPYNLYTKNYNEDIPQLFVSALLITMGLSFIIFNIYSYIKKNNNNIDFLNSLGVFAILIGIWRFTDTRTTPLILLNKPIFIFNCCLSAMAFSIIAMLNFLLFKYEGRAKKIISSYTIFSALSLIAIILISIHTREDLRSLLFYIHLVIAIGCILIIILNIYYVCNYKRTQKFDFPVIFVLLGVLLDMRLYYISENSDKMYLTIISLFLYILYHGINGFMRLYKQEEILNKQKEELDKTRIQTLIAQIQPHFIYNTLGTIEYLCKENPEVASSVTHDFAIYLRGNLKELNRNSLIPLENEIDHTKRYIAIEKVRFPDIEVQFDLKVKDFSIPAITIQPLVENAIKHGLMGLESGGHIYIRSFENINNYYIEIEDDGIGFDYKMISHLNERVGIKNIKTRLKIMLDAELEIISIKDKGTKATIIIPKEKF